MVKVSIIIPVYNSGNYIEKCISSLQKQTFKDFEIILINDGSIDNTLQVITKLAETDSRIKVFDQQNVGVAETRNFGIEVSSGKYIMFIDNDDWINEDYVEMFYNKITKTKADVVVGGYNRTNDDKIMFTKKILNTIDIYSQLAPWAKIYDRDFLIKNNIKFFSNPIGEDVYFSLLIYNKSKNLECFDYIGYNWYYNPNSISNSKQKKGDKDLNVIRLLDKVYNETNFDNFIEYFYIRYCVWFTLFTIRDTNSKAYIKNYTELFKWLKEKCPNYRKNDFLKFKNNSDFKTLLIIKTILLLQTIKLDKIIFKTVNIIL